jgi:acetamidase/formamidase
MKRLSRDKYTTVLDPTLPPAITIASGEELLVETWDAYKDVWGADQEPPEVGAATGPIAVEGAHPGDALRIDIVAITPATAAMHDVRPAWLSWRDVYRAPSDRDAHSRWPPRLPRWHQCAHTPFHRADCHNAYGDTNHRQ